MGFGFRVYRVRVIGKHESCSCQLGFRVLESGVPGFRESGGIGPCSIIPI